MCTGPHAPEVTSQRNGASPVRRTRGAVTRRGLATSQACRPSVTGASSHQDTRAGSRRCLLSPGQSVKRGGLTVAAPAGASCVRFLAWLVPLSFSIFSLSSATATGELRALARLADHYTGEALLFDAILEASELLAPGREHWRVAGRRPVCARDTHRGLAAPRNCAPTQRRTRSAVTERGRGHEPGLPALIRRTHLGTSQLRRIEESPPLVGAGASIMAG